MKQILVHVQPEDYFIAMDLKDAYFHILIAPHHRRFLCFAFGGVAYQFRVLPFGLALAPRMFTMCMNAVLAPLKLSGMRVLNYLDDWLIIAQARNVRGGAQVQALSPSGIAGAVCKHAEEQTSALPVYHLPGYGSGLALYDRALIRAENTVHPQHTFPLYSRQSCPLENVSKATRSDGSRSLRLQAGVASYETAAALVAEPSTAAGLESGDGTPNHNAFMSRDSGALVRHDH
ncbi:MAG: reverse transcriptase domain-containing protein, partial [Plesiomonas sp.]